MGGGGWLQAAARGHLARRRYVKAKAGMTRLQAWARMRRARRAYKLALAEAKEQVRAYHVVLNDVRSME